MGAQAPYPWTTCGPIWLRCLYSIFIIYNFYIRCLQFKIYSVYSMICIINIYIYIYTLLWNRFREGTAPETKWQQFGFRSIGAAVRAVVMAILLGGGGCKMKILPTELAWQLIEFHFMNLCVKFADMPVSILSLNVNKLQKVSYPASLKM